MIVGAAVFCLASSAGAEPMSPEDAQAAWDEARAEIRTQIDGIKTLQVTYHANNVTSPPPAKLRPGAKSARTHYDVTLALGNGIMLRSDDYNGGSYQKVNAFREGEPVFVKREVAYDASGHVRTRDAKAGYVLDGDVQQRLNCALPHNIAGYDTIYLAAGPNPILTLSGAERSNDDCIVFEFDSTLTDTITRLHCRPSMKHLPEKIELFSNPTNRDKNQSSRTQTIAYAEIADRGSTDGGTIWYPKAGRNHHGYPYMDFEVQEGSVAINSDIPEVTFKLLPEFGEGEFSHGDQTWIKLPKDWYRDLARDQYGVLRNRPGACTMPENAPGKDNVEAVAGD